MKGSGKIVLGALGLLGASCSGGGGGGEVDERPALSFETGAQSVSESAGSVDLVVTLTAVAGPLAADLEIEVIDRGTGTAGAGEDYGALPTTVLTFPAGSETGETRTAAVSLLGDSIAEGADETIVFGLAPTPDAQLGSATQTVTLEDAHVATVSFQSATSVTPDESSSNHSVLVELDVTNGGSLGFDLDVDVQDEGTGSATAGSDYTALGSVSVTFTSGTADGATRTVDVGVLDDGDAEGTETLALVLAPGSGVAPGAMPRHTVTITDDELPPSGIITMTSGPTGSESSRSSGDTLDLGLAVNDSGPNTGTYVRVQNDGGAAMALGAPVLSGSNPEDFLIEVDSSSFAPAASPAAPIELDFAAPFARVARTPAGDAAASPGVEARFDASALAGLEAADVARLHGVPLPGLGDVTFELERQPLPITDDAVLEVDGARVPGGPAAVLGDLSLWRGSVPEIPGAYVFVTLGSDGAEGFVRLPFEGANTVHIHSSASESWVTASTPLPGEEPPVSTLLVREEDLLVHGAERAPLCGGEELVPGTTLDLELSPLAEGTPSIAQSVIPPNCRIAIETDYQLYQRFGSTSALTSYVTSLMAAISDQYQTDVQTTLSIAYLGVHSSSSDPWSTPETPGGDTGDMLSEFRSAWNSSGWPVSADLAHFLSGDNLGGGIAYVNVLCNSSFGYGVSANLNGNINWGSWTGAAGSFTWDFVVVAHELGHNFGTGHTHSYCPPIDVCYDNCSASTSCSQGTIMSYCHTCGGMDNIDLRFHQQVANVMRQRVESSCLGDAAMGTGDWVRYRLRFAPETGAGAKSATLTFDHDAPNASDPFTLSLDGTAQ
ncbi:MAG: M12 family metallo-peptidase [Planctomycetota bacterium]